MKSTQHQQQLNRRPVRRASLLSLNLLGVNLFGVNLFGVNLLLLSLLTTACGRSAAPPPAAAKADATETDVAGIDASSGDVRHKDGSATDVAPPPIPCSLTTTEPWPKAGEPCTTVGERACSTEGAERYTFSKFSVGYPHQTVCRATKMLRCTATAGDLSPHWSSVGCDYGSTVDSACFIGLLSPAKQPLEVRRECRETSSGSRCCPSYLNSQPSAEGGGAVAEACAAVEVGKRSCVGTNTVRECRVVGEKALPPPFMVEATWPPATTAFGRACLKEVVGCSFWHTFYLDELPHGKLKCFPQGYRKKYASGTESWPPAPRYVKPHCKMVDGKVTWSQTCEELGFVTYNVD